MRAIDSDSVCGEYIAITDHSQSLSMANGLDEGRALANAEKIRAYSKTLKGFTVLAGIECDIRAPDSVEDMMTRVFNEGPLTGLVNNAAGGDDLGRSPNWASVSVVSADPSMDIPHPLNAKRWR